MTEIRLDDPYKKILRKTWDQQIPFRVLWELTYRCNERCRHCYIVDPEVQEELTTTEACSLIDELAEAGALFLTFTGGEPLLRDDFFDIADYSRRQGFAIRLLTNGTLISEGVADRLKSLNPVSIEVSLYGILPEIHDSITQVPGSHEKSLRALHLLHEKGVRVKVKTPLMERTADQFQELRTLADSLGGGFTYDTTLVPADDGSYRPMIEAMKPVTLERFYMCHLNSWNLIQHKPKDRPCSAGINIATITPYGIVNPCVQMRIMAGNVREQNFGKIWKESTVLHKLKKITFADLHDCKGCELQPYCVRCPGVAYIETGDLTACSRVAREDAKARLAALKEKNITPVPGGKLQECEKN